MEPVQLVVRATARLYQRISALFILSGAFVGLLFFLLYFVANSSYLFPLFDGIVNPQFRGRIGFERLNWGPNPGALKLIKPKIWRPDGKEIFAADSLVIDEVKLGGLLRQNIEVSGFVVEAGRLHLTARSSQQSLDWQGNPKQLFDIEETFWPPGPRYDTGEPAGVLVSVSGIALRDFTVRLDMPEASIVQEGVSIEGGRFEAEPDAQRVRMSASRLHAEKSELRVRREDSGPPPLEGTPDTYYQWTIDELRLRNYTWRDDVFSLDKVRLAVDGDPVSLDHYRMDLRVPGPPEMGGKISAEVADLSRHLSQFGLSEIRGPVSLKLSGRGPPDAFAGTFSVDGRQLSVFGETVDRLRIQGTQDADGLIDLDRVEVTALKGIVDGQATFDPVADRLAGELTLSGVDLNAVQYPLPQIVDTVGIGRWRGELGFRARGMMGPSPQYSTHGRLLSNASVRRGQGLGKAVDLEWALKIDEPMITVHTLVLTSDQLKVTARGNVDLVGAKNRLRGQLSVRDVSLLSADLGVNLSGTVDDSAWFLTGPLASPKIEAEIAAQQLQYDVYPAADFESLLTYDGGRLIFEPKGTMLRIANGETAVRGYIDVNAPRTPLNLSLSMRNVAVEAFPLPTPTKQYGRVSADVTFAGPTNALSVEGQVRGLLCVRLPNGEELPKGCQKFNEGALTDKKRRPRYVRMDAAGRWKGQDVTVDSLKVLSKEGRETAIDLEGQGRLNLARQDFEAKVKLTGLLLPEVGRLTRVEGEPALPVRGSVSIEVDAQGDFTRPTGNGRLTLRGLGYDQYPLGDGVLLVDAGGEVVSITGKVFEKFQITAGVPTRQQGRLANAELTFDALSIEDFLPQMEGLPIKTSLGGRIEAKVNLFRGKIHGINAHLDQLETTYQISTQTGSQAQENIQSFLVSNVEPVKISLRHEVVNIDNFLLSVDRAGGVVERSSPSAILAPIAGRTLGGPATIPSGVVNVAASFVLPMIEQATLPVNETRVKLAGTVGTDQTLDLAATGIVNLDLVQPFLKSIFTEMSGSSSFDLQLSGTTSNPRPEGILQLFLNQAQPRSNVIGGELRMEEVATFRITPETGPYPLRDDGTPMGGLIKLLMVDLDAFGRPTQLAGKPMRIIRDESELNVTQLAVDFEEFIPQDVEVKTSFVEQEVNVPRVLRATLGTPLGKELTFQMTHKNSERQRLKEPLFSLEGDLNVFWGEYVADIDIDPTAALTDTFSGKTQQKSVDVFEANPALRRLKLKLRLMGDGDFYIKNKISDLDVDLGLEIKLALEEISGYLAPKPETATLEDESWERLQIEGLITVLPDSTLDYANQKFDVSNGRITFDKNIFVNALVEAKREYDVGGSAPEEVKLTVEYEQPDQATPSKPKIKLSTASGLSKVQAASLVFTGRLPSDITAGAAGAGGAAAGLLLAPIMNLVERPLEDTFDFKLNLAPDADGQLTIGSELNFSQRLRGSFRLVGSADKSYGLELQLNNRLFLELESEQSETDVDTTLRFRGTWELD